MKMILDSVFRFGRRQLHTIVSREIIKPSSPTPSHLRTYNLSILDHIGRAAAYVPLILFYPNNVNHHLTLKGRVKEMKKSLSQSLTQYYPLAGRLHTPTIPYVDCNDEGIVFLEARNDSHMETFQHMRENDESLDQLFADNMVCYNSPGNTSLVGVQLNHFACGGLGVAVSMSHAIGDGCTLGSFVSYWASVARYGSIDHEEVQPLTPRLIYHPLTILDSVHPEGQIIKQGYENHVSRKFMFPNKKLSDLKNKVAAKSSLHITNLTRVEVLTSLLYRTAVAAATSKAGSFKPSYLFMPVDIRNKLVQKLPKTTVGNFLSHMMVKATHRNETSLCVVVAEIKKEKVQLERVQSLSQAAERTESLFSKLEKEELDRSYRCSSVCGFSYNKVDFGWGNAMGSTFAFRSLGKSGFLLMDTPDGSGIEALVILEKEDMEIFENDKEMLSFCQIN